MTELQHDGLNEFEQNAGLLKARGNAEQFFRDDPVRILRMIKFAAELDLQIETQTWQEAQDLIALLVSAPRGGVTAALAEILVLTNADKAVRMLDQVGYWDLFVPELARLKGVVQNQYHALDAWEHTLSVFQATPPDLFLRLAGLFHDLGKWEVAGREYYLAGMLEYKRPHYRIERYTLTATRDPKELDYKLKPHIGRPVKILGARLDQYPDTVQFKRLLTGGTGVPGLEPVPNGKRHFLGHEKASARLLAAILERYTFAMLLDGGQKREQDLLRLIENHMLATLTFMPEFRNEPSRKPLQDRMTELVRRVCWDGRSFELQRLRDFIALWKADFHAGKVHSSEQLAMFETISAQLMRSALRQQEDRADVR